MGSFLRLQKVIGADRFTVLLIGGRLPPWRSVRVACDHCDRSAKWVLDSAAEPIIEPGIVHVGGMSGQARELVCDAHWETRSLVVCAEHGGADSVPVRTAWGAWLRSLPPLWEWNRWWNAIDWDWPVEPVQRLRAFRWGWLSIDGLRMGTTLTRWGAGRRHRKPKGGLYLDVRELG